MAMDTLKENVIFTNCALTDEGDVWWEGMDGDPPKHAIDWKGNDWTPDSPDVAAHANARFTAPAAQCPVICEDWEKPEGVPIDIFIFGGRRSSVVPLVTEAYNWDHGVFLGSTAASETTAANIGAVGNLRRDPFAMKPFCGYNMGDYFQHWMEMGDKLGDKAPRCFYVNWFRKSEDGKFLWPGFSDNSRVLKWMCERVDGKVGAEETPIGLLPRDGDLDTQGLDTSADDLKELLKVDAEAWKAEIPDIENHFTTFGDRLPDRLKKQLEEFRHRLG
jgi:phosphoenolpyruvate carboxykinase (GTP)